MELKDLFSTGSHLADVPADFRGMPMSRWLSMQITEECSKYVATLDPEKAPLNRKAVWTPRDDYGMKGVRTSFARKGL